MDQNFEEDIEMMDTEDIPDIIENVSSSKRKISPIDETIVASVVGISSPNKSPDFHFRPVLKARRVLPKMSSQESNKNFSITVEESLKPICVLDTNILVSNLIELKNIILTEEKLRQTTSKSKLKSIVIPWIVVQELDKLKNRKPDKSVVNVIHFINEQLKKSNGLVKGENDLTSKSNNNFEKIEEQINDDKIVNCCLKLKSIPNSKNIILITNDLNLCNKALITQLNAMNWNQFNDKYKSSDLYSFENKIEDKEQPIEPKSKRFAKTRPRNSVQNHSSKTLVNTSPLKSLRPLYTSEKTSPTVRKHNKSPNKKRPQSCSKVSQKTDYCNNDGTNNSLNVNLNDCPLKYDDWIRFKDECEQKLLKFIERIYREIWGNDWKTMLEIDSNNTHLKEIVRLIRKEWTSNFSDQFNRDRTVKELVDTLHTSLSKSGANYQLFYNDLKRFVDLVQQKQNNDYKNNRKTI